MGLAPKAKGPFSDLKNKGQDPSPLKLNLIASQGSVETKGPTKIGHINNLGLETKFRWQQTKLLKP